MKKLTLEELKKEYETYHDKKLKNEQKNFIKLEEELVDFFLLKIDAFKFLNRVKKQYYIRNDEYKIREFLNIRMDIELEEFVLKKAFKEKDLPNKILSSNEKKALKELYLNQFISKDYTPVKKSDIKNAKLIEREEKERENLIAFIEDTKKFILTIPELDIEPSKIKKLIKKRIGKIQTLNKLRNLLTLEEETTLNILSNKLKTYAPSLIIKKKKQKVDKKSLFIEEERLKQLDYERKIIEFRYQEEQELLKRIEARKNGLLNLQNESNQKKDEPIIIEAYLEDFNSERSRFVLSVLAANNLHISFYNGTIKLIDEDESYNKINFSSSMNILTFANEKYSKNIEIDISSKETIGNLLLSQTSNKDQVDLILNCLSILYYINTFYNEKEKIEVIYEPIEEKDIQTHSDEVRTKQNIVYLSNNKKKQIKTIKIKKGKRSVSGAFLIRGHWRRQKYLTGVKLIWIEPFWKGMGNHRKKVYKIKNNN